MKVTVKQIIGENNEKRKLLTSENEKFYSDFLLYIRSAMFKDERATEEVLLEFLDHLLFAQSEGKTAEDIFGKVPKQLADEVIETLPRDSSKSIFLFAVELLATLISSYVIISGLIDLFTKNNRVLYVGNTVTVIVSLSLYLCFIIYLFSHFLKSESYKKKSKVRTAFLFIAFVVGFVAVTAIPILIEPFGPSLQLGLYGMLIIAIILILTAFVLKKYREAK